MILYPSVDDLLERVDSRYSLIMLASKRAHKLEEVVAGDVIIDPNEKDL